MNMGENSVERTLESKLLHDGKYLKFLRDEVELPNGNRTYRNIVRHQGAVAIIPIFSDNRIILVSQYRYAAGKTLLEIPAGTLEPGETPVNCAIRELIEETGYRAGHMEMLLSCYMAPGYSSEIIHFFLAEDLIKVGKKTSIDEEIAIKVLKKEEITKMINNNKIQDAKTIIGISILKNLSQAQNK